MRSYSIGYIYKNKRSFLGDSFYIYDIMGRKVRVNSMPDVGLTVKNKDKKWAVRRYRASILMKVKVSYDGDKHNAEWFHFWLNNVPLNWSHFGNSRGMLAYYTLYLFNVFQPQLVVHNIVENRVIITDDMYLTKFSKQSLRDLNTETRGEASKHLDDMA